MLPIPVGSTAHEELETGYGPDELETTAPLEAPELREPTLEAP